MTQSSNIETLRAFKTAFSVVSELPYCTGTVALDPSVSSLFYRNEGESARIIDFTNATDSQLEALAHACQQASFGIDQQDVIDETYRRAGKMDTANFSSQLSIHSSGILENAVNYLLRGQSSPVLVKAELYKLNVYGPGSFFKPHVDTPRSDKMFGSLVVIFPTIHEGGSLVFTRADQKWVFDSAKAISSHASPHVAFVAFYSDVEHEVLPVTSGYRVTLTYNLYNTSDIPQSIPIEDEHLGLTQMQDSLAALLADPAFLPKGGLLGFALTYKYPFTPGSTKLSNLAEHLKGTDATLKRLCEALSLKVSLKALYRLAEDDSQDYEDLDGQEVFCMMDNFANFGQCPVEEGMLQYLTYAQNALLVYNLGDKPPVTYSKPPIPIAWIKPLLASNSFQTPYVAFGNEARMDAIYGEVCLVVDIEAAKLRLRLSA